MTFGGNRKHHDGEGTGRQDCDRESDSFNRNIPTESEVANANKDGNHQFWKEHWKLRGGRRWRH